MRGAGECEWQDGAGRALTRYIFCCKASLLHSLPSFQLTKLLLNSGQTLSQGAACCPSSLDLALGRAQLPLSIDLVGLQPPGGDEKVGLLPPVFQLGLFRGGPRGVPLSRECLDLLRPTLAKDP